MPILSRVPYKRLKVELGIAEIGQKYLSKFLGRSASYVQQRLSGDAPWNMDEVYTMCDILKIPYERIHEYFPRNGVIPKGAEPPDPSLIAYKKMREAEKKASKGGRSYT